MMFSRNLKVLALLGLVTFAACDKDDDPMFIPTPPELTGPVDGFTTVVTADNLDNELSFTWTKATFEGTSVITYKIQVAPEGSGFSTVSTIGTASGNSVNVTYADLNDALITGLGLAANTSVTVDARVVASAAGKADQASESIQLHVTTYEVVVVAPNLLWLPGGYQNWDPATAPKIAEMEPGIYEGYVYLNIETGIKFTSHADWDHINYGDDGNGGLTTDGNAPALTLGPGYLRIIVNTNDLTYQADLIESWGLIGTATTGQWDSSTPMTYNQVTGEWTKTINLMNGALKFRANDNWDINLGPENSNRFTGELIKTDQSITIPPGTANYTIRINLNNGVPPYTYTYSVQQN